VIIIVHENKDYQNVYLLKLLLVYAAFVNKHHLDNFRISLWKIFLQILMVED